MLPWSFKFAFGLLNDTRPLLGYRRKPYMVIGWSVCTLCLLVLHFRALPDPYWCRDENGEYITTVKGPDGRNQAAEPCNESASRKGGHFAFLMMLASLGYVVADVAAEQAARHQQQSGA